MSQRQDRAQGIDVATVLKNIAWVVGLIVLFAVVGRFLLLVFAAALIAVAFSILARAVKRWTGVSTTAALGIVCLAVLVLLLVLGIFSGPSLIDQGQQLGTQLMTWQKETHEWLGQRGWGRQLLQRLNAGQGSEAVSQAGGAVMGIFGALGALLVAVAAALYFAGDPRLYVDGTIRLFPPERRARMREIFDACGATLSRWLLGQAIGMAFVTILVYVGLTVLGVPLAPLLALIAGLLNFVPYVGAFAGSVPALMVAANGDPQTMIWVAVLFLAVQMIHGYVIDPRIQEKTASLPPAMSILSQTVLGMLFGIIGIVLATPILAVVITIVRMAYVEDVLEQPKEKAEDSLAVESEPIAALKQA
ncbi:AI-2E family transporter [Nevskia sp.]|uniref:AI-2E family transporter n=1 Tax=Nevskia sp. TaxID=1929292 RepID=UPI0025DA753B|nr:AI-2E family transporter [Nevskia sp.]